MESVSLYSEARNEYLKQMSSWIVPPLVEFFRKEFVAIQAREGPKRVMGVFQTWCSEVPRWNQDVIDKNVDDLLDSCRCDYVEELMTAVFIAHTKMLTAIRINTRAKKLQITLPKLDHFLHRVFVECARAFWKAPFLFSEEQPLIERQKNILHAETMCSDAISGAVRSLLPVKNILRDNLEGGGSDEEDEIVRPTAHKKKTKKVEPEPESESDSESEEEEEVLVAPVLKVEEPVVVPVVAPVVKIEDPIETPAPIKVEEPVVAPVVKGGAEPIPVKVEEPVVAPKIEEPVLTKILSPEPTRKVELIKEEPEQVIIDTEPSVHFTPYDTVYDETTPNISEIRYTPKISIEEMPYEEEDWGFRNPPIQIQGEPMSFDVEEVDKDTSEDIMDLGMSDFVEL
jgi:hypothetical protein